jgi:hypothetical protein
MTRQIKTRVRWAGAGVVCTAVAVLGAMVAAYAAGPFAMSIAAWQDDPPPLLGPPTTGEGDEGRGDPGEKPEKAADQPGLRKLTAQEINRIRYLELRGMRLKTDRPDRVMVTIPPETLEEFLRDMEGDPDFKGKQAVRNFHKLTPPQKLHQMAYYKGAKYADKVKIASDPEVFVSFRKNVLPVVQRGCAAPNCHAATNDSADMRFRLFKDPKRLPETTYADFIILNDIELGGYRMIDRAKPEESLLLTYMLPVKDVKSDLRHPGGIELKPLFRTANASGYRQIVKWIKSLKHPAEDYGVHLYQPGDESAGSRPDDEAERPAEPPKPGGEKPPETQPAEPRSQPTGPG